MTDLLPWPYAAKAIVQHEFEIDHLNIWLTFRLAMDQTRMPLLDKWLLYVDTVPTLLLSGSWQDAFTLLLCSDAVASSPTRVLLGYDGPSQNLRAKTVKCWEPWGPILSQDLLA
jgi:hypothetical protein